MFLDSVMGLNWKEENERELLKWNGILTSDPALIPVSVNKKWDITYVLYKYVCLHTWV